MCFVFPCKWKTSQSPTCTEDMLLLPPVIALVLHNEKVSHLEKFSFPSRQGSHFRACKVFAREIYGSHVRTRRVLILRKQTLYRFQRKCFELRTEVVGLLTHIVLNRSFSGGFVWHYLNNSRLVIFTQFFRLFTWHLTVKSSHRPTN